MPKTLEELLETKETSTPFPPVPGGRYALKVVDVRYNESYIRDADGREIAPKVRMQLKVEDSENADEVGRSAFVTLFIDQDGRTFGFIKHLYRKLSGSGLLDGFKGNAVTNDELAQQFTASVVDGTIDARLGIRLNRTTNDEENILGRIY